MLADGLTLPCFGKVGWNDISGFSSNASKGYFEVNLPKNRKPEKMGVLFHLGVSYKEYGDVIIARFKWLQEKDLLVLSQKVLEGGKESKPSNSKVINDQSWGVSNDD